MSKETFYANISILRFLASLESCWIWRETQRKKQTMDLGGDRSIFCNL